jgi:hypothetical protein
MDRLKSGKKFFFPLGYEYKRNYFTAGDLQSNLKEKFCQFFFVKIVGRQPSANRRKKSDCI